MKECINDFIVNGARDAVNPACVGTKAAAHYQATVGAGESVVLRLRLSHERCNDDGTDVGADFDAVFDARRREADEFYATVIPNGATGDATNVMRQALAGMLWSKQFYHYVIADWLKGAPTQPAP